MSYTQTDNHERESCEFRIQSKGDSGFQWVLGAFSETSTRDYEIEYLWPGLNPGGLSFQPTNGQWWNLDKSLKPKNELEGPQYPSTYRLPPLHPTPKLHIILLLSMIILMPSPGPRRRAGAPWP